MKLQRKGDKARYEFLESDCLGRECFAAGMYQHRSQMAGGGSRNTGSPDTPCCLNRAYRGCPSGPMHGLPMVNSDLKKQRRAEGWSVSR